MFHLENARKAGHKDEDIVKHLASKLGFDHEKAMEAGHSAAAIAEYLSTAKERVKEEIKAEEPIKEEVKIEEKPDLSQKEVKAYASVNGHYIKIPMKTQEALDTNQAMTDMLKKPFDEIMGMIPTQLKKDVKEDFKTFREQGLTKRKAQKKVIEDLKERFKDERKEIEEQVT